MREVIEEVERWRREGRRVALATVVATWGSAPRRPGATMAVASGGGIAGSVSGGCVEGAVVEAAREVLAGGEPRLLRFGVADEDAWAVGLSCGGEVEVFVQALASAAPAGEEGVGEPPAAELPLAVYRELRRALADERPVALATVVAGSGLGTRLLAGDDGPLAGAPPSSLAAPLAAGAGAALAAGAPRRDALTAAGGERQVFFDLLLPRPRLLIVGAVHAAIPLVTIARELGFATVVIDPRTAFATGERFAHADRLIRDWPPDAFAGVPLDAATSVALLSHDPKLDLPALRAVLRAPVGYIGALGSRKTHARRRRALADEGFTDDELARIHAPIGLDLGGRRPEEIALAVIAEVVAVRNRREP